MNMQYDAEIDVVTICGVKYAGAMFRSLALAEPGTWIRIESNLDGALGVRGVDDTTRRTFDAITGCAAPARA